MSIFACSLVLLCQNRSQSLVNLTRRRRRLTHRRGRRQPPLQHAYLPIVCLVFGEVENLFGRLVPFRVRVLPSLEVEPTHTWSIKRRVNGEMEKHGFGIMLVTC